MVRVQGLKWNMRQTTVGVLFPRPDPVGGTNGMSVEPRPGFQTKERWPKSAKSMLVTKAICGYVAPNFHLAKNLGLDLKNPSESHPIFGETNCEWVTVDGQQRWISWSDFFLDAVALERGTVIEVNGELVNFGGKRWSFIRDNYPTLRDYILNIEISVLEYTDFTLEQIREQFRLLQLGSPLNGAEQRHAQEGKIGAFVDKAVDMPFFRTRFNVTNRRMKHLEMVEKFLYLTVEDGFADVSKANLDRWRVAAESNFKPRGADAKLVLEFIDAAAVIWGGPDCHAPKTTETLAIFCLWYRNRDVLRGRYVELGKALDDINNDRLDFEEGRLSAASDSAIAKLARAFKAGGREKREKISDLVLAYELNLRLHRLHLLP